MVWRACSTLLRTFEKKSIYKRQNSSDITKQSMMSASKELSKVRSDSESSSESGYRESRSDSNIKRVFKFYKRRDTEPDFSKVLNLRHSLPAQGIICAPFIPKETPSHEVLDRLGLKPLTQWTISTIHSRPGMVMLNDIFQPSRYMEWISRALYVYAEKPGFTNVGLHFPEATEIFKNHAKQLRWATLGLHYDWATKTYPTKGEPLPSELALIADVLSRALGLGKMSADAVIINYYGKKSTLAPHVDRSERVTLPPLISLSFGQPAIYLAGGQDLDDDVAAFYIHTGDVLIIYDEQRLIYHAVPRIVKTEHYDSGGVAAEVVSYANENRVNITIRQVDDHP